MNNAYVRCALAATAFVFVVVSLVVGDRDPDLALFLRSVGELLLVVALSLLAIAIFGYLLGGKD